MKVMLLLPPLPLKRSSNDGRWGQKLDSKQTGYVTMPMCLLALKSVTPPDVEVILGDLTCEDEDAMFEIAKREKVDVVGISAYTSTAPAAYRLAKRFKTLGCTTVLGGVHPTLLPDEAKQHADVVFVGEAEDTWPQFLRDHQKGEHKAIYKTCDQPDMAQFKPVLAEGINHDKYQAYMIETSRGCPFNCNFCTIPEVNGNAMRAKSMECLEAELRYVAKSVKEGKYLHFILFVDSNFYGNRPHMHKVLKLLIKLREEGVEVPYFLVATSLNTMRDPENLELLAKGGARQVYIGFESLEIDSLKAVLKLHHRNMDYDEVVGNMRKHGIQISASFIIGHDTDSARYIDSVVEFCDRNGILFPEINILTPLPGSQLFAMMDAEGRILSKDWERYTCQEAVYAPRGRYKSPRDVEAAYLELLNKLADPDRLWRAFLNAEKLMPPDTQYLDIGAATMRPCYMMHKSVRQNPSGKYNFMDRVYNILLMLWVIVLGVLDRKEIKLCLKLCWYFLWNPISLQSQIHMSVMFDFKDYVKFENERLGPKIRENSESNKAKPIEPATAATAA